MLTVYRIAYGPVLVIFLGNVAISSTSQHSASTTALLLLAGVLLLSILGLVFRFSRAQPLAFWVLARIIHVFRDKKSLLCYKQVV